MPLRDLNVVDVVCLLSVVPFVNFLHDLSRVGIDMDLCAPPFRIRVEAMRTSLNLCVSTCLVDFSHETSRIEDIVVRKSWILDEFEPISSIDLCVGIEFSWNPLNPYLLVRTSRSCVIR